MAEKGLLTESRTFTVLSRGSIEIALCEVMEDGKLAVFPHIEAKGLLFLQFKRGILYVTAGKFIGLIPLTPTISIDVRPKLPVSNLAYVLDNARTAIDTIPNAARLYRPNAIQSTSVLQFLLSNLLEAIQPIRTNGLIKEYARRSEIMSQPRGRIALSGTLQRCWSKGVRHKVQVQKFEHTTDNSANRLIKHALEYALVVLRRVPESHSLLRYANEVYVDLPGEIGAILPKDYFICQKMVRSRNISILRSYYYQALEISLLILSRHVVSLEHSGSEILLQTFIIDFEEVFEEYIRRTLHASAPSDIIVHDGNRDGKKPLFDDRNDPPAQPDIVVRRGGQSVIGEVKYKEKPDRSDINQAITYAVSYRSNQAVLIHQRRSNGPRGMQILGVVNGITVRSYAYDLASADLPGESALFSEAMFSLLPASAIQSEAA